MLLLNDLCVYLLVQSQTAMMLDGMNVFDRQIRVNMARGGSGPGIVRSNDPDRVQRTIHIGGLPFDELSEETIAEYFSHVGEVHLATPCTKTCKTETWQCLDNHMEFSKSRSDA